MAETEQPVNIAIIGGGFCGIITAIHLLRDTEFPLHIHIINKGSVFGKGVAYDPHTDGLLLNVPNGKMSAFDDKPADYLQWLKENYQLKDDPSASFSTRKQYGEYLSDKWDNALTGMPLNKAVTVYDDFATDVIEDGENFQIILKGHPALSSAYVILATGNAPPRLPIGVYPAFTQNKCYFADPWKKACVKNTDHATGDILIIGNGLTTADTVIGLIENGCRQTIHSVSPHGYRLNPWVEDKLPYNGFNVATIPPNETSLLALLRKFNKHRKLANQLDQSFYPVIDSLRPHIQKLWLGFSLKEKERFLSNLKPFWEKVRHRLPVELHKRVNELRQSGQLITYKGNINSVNEFAGGAEVVLNYAGSLKTIRVQRVINCTGPDPCILRQGNVLLTNLAVKGLIQPGPCGIGLQANAGTGNIIAADGQSKTNLYAIGNNLKGVLWESTAVPELRLQAKNLAGHVISAIRKNYHSVVESS